MKDSVIIVSGGMDSVTMLHEYCDRIAVGISFDYGSNHNAREIPFARMHCERLGIKHIVISLDFMNRYFKSSLLEGADAVPDGHYADENMKSTVVPFRNGIMLSIAVGIAESNGLRYVMMANHGGDHSKVCLLIVKRRGNRLLRTGWNMDTLQNRNRKLCCLTVWGMCCFRHCCLMMWNTAAADCLPISTQYTV